MKKVILMFSVLIILSSLSLCLAAEKFIDKDNKEWAKKNKVKDYSAYTEQKFSTKLNISGYYEGVIKPNINENKLLTDIESDQVKMALWNEGLIDEANKVVKEGRKLISKHLRPARNDYKHDYDRGSVKFNPTKKLTKLGEKFLNGNYSFHKIIIPDGTIIEGVNFTQKEPHTQAIEGKNLTFKSCNLVNVELDPTWIIEDCNTAQIKRIITVQEQVDEGIKLHISHQVEKNGQFIEVDTYEKIVYSYDDLNNKLRRYNQ